MTTFRFEFSDGKYTIYEEINKGITLVHEVQFLLDDMGITDNFGDNVLVPALAIYQILKEHFGD